MEEDAELVDNSRQKAPDSHRSAQDQRNARISELENEVERYRRASEDALSAARLVHRLYARLREKRVGEITFEKPRIHPHTLDETAGGASAQSRDRRELTLNNRRLADES